MTKNTRLILTGIAFLAMVGFIAWDLFIEPSHVVDFVVNDISGYFFGTVLGWLWSYNGQPRDARGRFVKS